MAAKAQAAPTRLLISVLITAAMMALLAFAIIAVAVLLAGKSPVDAVQQLIQGAVGTRTNLAASITRSIPIILCGVGAVFAVRAGLFNLGLEGQMVMGALAAAVVANTFPTLPTLVLLPLTILAGCIAGALWALPPAWWQVSYKVPILISTLLLNYIAVLFASYMVNFPLRDMTGSTAVAQTMMIPEAVRFANTLPGTRLHNGVFVLFIVPVFAYWFLRRTRLGYQLRMSGLNPDFAAYGGISVARMTLLAMAASGAVAGLAGTVQVLGVDFRYIDTALTTGGFAWTGFIAAILAQGNPLAVVLTGFFLGSMEVGAAGMQRNTQIPLQIADIVQAGVIFIVAVRERIGQSIGRLVGVRS